MGCRSWGFRGASGAVADQPIPAWSNAPDQWVGLNGAAPGRRGGVAGPDEHRDQLSAADLVASQSGDDEPVAVLGLRPLGRVPQVTGSSVRNRRDRRMAAKRLGWGSGPTAANTRMAIAAAPRWRGETPGRGVGGGVGARGGAGRPKVVATRARPRWSSPGRDRRLIWVATSGVRGRCAPAAPVR